MLNAVQDRSKYKNIKGAVALLWGGLTLSLLFLWGCTPTTGPISGDNEPVEEGGNIESAAVEAALQEVEIVMDQAGLERNEWRLVIFQGDDQRVALDAGEVTLKFEDGKVSGQAACNNYNTTYSVAVDGTLNISEQILMTRMLCDEARNALEKAFTEALPKVTGAVDDGGNLRLTYPDGELMFEPLP